jgi:hypothetical protein
MKIILSEAEISNFNDFGCMFRLDVDLRRSFIVSKEVKDYLVSKGVKDKTIPESKWNNE